VSVRVVLVDDHQPFRERLRALLQRDRHIEIVGETSSGSDLLEIVRATEVDVVCMDIRLPGMTGIEATRRLLALRPDVRVIGLSAYAEPHYVEGMLDAGAAGHFTKGDVGDALLRAIHEATPGHPQFGANIGVPLSVRATPLHAPGARDATADVTSFGTTETEILRQIGRGLATAAIADALSLEPALVDVYRRNIMRKLHLADENALRDYARVWSLKRDRSGA
jgi:two-component system NarL family response regulator